LTNSNGDLLAAYVNAYNRADWQELGEYVSPGYIHHSGDQIRDLNGFIEGSIWFHNAFPDLRVEVHDMISEGDRVAMRFALRGTHNTSVLGEEPTGREVTLDGTTIFRFEDGVIAEDWEMMDEGQLRRQLGM
jgi:steroid delta-isomerase-like uncharacterized protein